ncbi:MAG: hypothetical protein KME35_20750, partial [Aphanocapsa sp. GSE-SYN-MK-11-07L]|nr:hypothetical protein [Aphanocapsa sp. GSE-SYN-MK-11-07L]
KQTFIIPEGARSLQFTLTGIDLDASDLAPGDAFEAALLDAQTHQPLVGTVSPTAAGQLHYLPGSRSEHSAIGYHNLECFSRCYVCFPNGYPV